MNPFRIVTILGARPQFIKASAVSHAIDRHNDSQPNVKIHEILVHTGQHYDYEMSAVFFRQLGLSDPAHHLGVGSAPHGAQTGRILERLEIPLIDARPDIVLVYGDTNTTLAGALAAAKLNIPVAHVEAGLRSFNRGMPEEINRVLTDHLCYWLFCPSQQAVENLAREGIRNVVHEVGDVMYDVHLWHLSRAKEHRSLLAELNVQPGNYALATVHRSENTDDSERLRYIFAGLEELTGNGMPVVIPLHPRTKKMLRVFNISMQRVKAISPVSYEAMLCLESNACVILTDSGGIQKEAYWLGVPCLTLREETEWVETVATGWNVIVGCDSNRIVETALSIQPNDNRPSFYGEGQAAGKIVRCLAEDFTPNPK